jgi:hypothetical protein
MIIVLKLCNKKIMSTLMFWERERRGEREKREFRREREGETNKERERDQSGL